MADRASDHLAWLMNWYAAQCDGDWEHSYGVKIDTLDNPGWLLTIDLIDTALAGRAFEPMAVNLDSPDGDGSLSWLHCKVEGGQFRAAGGPRDLLTMIGTFRGWAERQ